jgi:hypothetical protein
MHCRMSIGPYASYSLRKDLILKLSVKATQVKVYLNPELVSLLGLLINLTSETPPPITID